MAIPAPIVDPIQNTPITALLDGAATTGAMLRLSLHLLQHEDRASRLGQEFVCRTCHVGVPCQLAWRRGPFKDQAAGVQLLCSRDLQSALQGAYAISHTCKACLAA